MAITDESTRTQIVLAASIVAGKGADENAVAGEVLRIISRLSEGSPVMNAFDAIEKRDENTDKVKTFRAVILHVDKEITSNRGVLFLKTEPSKWHPNGKEFLRTEITKNNPAGTEMAKLAQSLIGHQVVLSVAVENTGEVKVRVLRNIEDQGPAEGYDQANPEFQADLDSTEPLRKLRPKLASQQVAGA